MGVKYKVSKWGGIQSHQQIRIKYKLEYNFEESRIELVGIIQWINKNTLIKNVWESKITVRDIDKD